MRKSHMNKRNKIAYSKYTIKLNSTFETALRSITSFDVHKISITNFEGKTGFGEVVVTPTITGVTTAELVSDIRKSLIPLLSEADLCDSDEFYSILKKKFPKNPTVRALGDLALHSLLQEYTRVEVSTDVTIPIIKKELLPTLIPDRIKDGFKVLKLKLDSASVLENISKIKMVKSLLPNETFLRIDPNQSWSVSYTLEFLDQLQKLGIEIEYLEQPIQRGDFKGLKLVREGSAVPIMADESCFDICDLEKLVEHDAADLVNIKILKVGGITPARELAKAAMKAQIKVSFGCMIESPLGVRAAMSLAAEFGPSQTHDLDAAWWYSQSELVYRGGTVK